MHRDANDRGVAIRTLRALRLMGPIADVIVSAVTFQHIRRAALVVALQVDTGPLGRAEARAKVIVHMVSVLRLVAV